MGVYRGIAPVLTQVTLHRAVDHDDIGTWSILAGVKQRIGTNTRVLRAGAAEVTRMFVPGGSIGAQACATVGGGFGVETVGGGYPEYTHADWDWRPEWMRTEPWRTRYAVDELLADFTPRYDDSINDGRQGPCEIAPAR
jgi:hypothetical protein